MFDDGPSLFSSPNVMRLSGSGHYTQNEYPLEALLMTGVLQ